MRDTRVTGVGMAVAVTAILGSGCGQQDVKELTVGEQAILQELREIRTLLEATPPRGAPAPSAQPQRVEVSLSGGHVLGSNDAPLTLVEFTDYQCPFCRRFSGSTLEELKRVYINTGQLRLVSRDMPLDIHDNAMLAANAARCADEQNRYWEMRATMFRNTNQLGQEALIGYAAALDLDGARFTECLTSDKYGDEVRRGVADALTIGLTGTPSFVLGKTSGDRLEGTIIVGALPFAAFDAEIKALLAEAD